MPRVQIHNVGTLGIIKTTDAPFHSIPPEAWSDGGNVRFSDKKVVKFTGHDEVFTQLTIAPYWLLGVPYLDSMFWLACGLTAVEAVVGASVYTITRAAGAYSALSDGRWSGGMLGNIAILNNQADIPQYWSSPVGTTLLQNLTNWPTAKRAKVLRPFKEFLVAGAITVDPLLPTEVYYPSRILVSHPADPGSVPSSWDPTVETLDVVEKDLNDENGGEVLDMLALNNDLIIYKEGSTWAMQYIGGTFVHKFTQIFENSGIMAMGCVAALPKNKGHFVYTGEDLVIHDGKTQESVVDGRWRQYLKDNIDATYFYRSFCVHNVAKKEMWFCFPESGQTLPSRAVTYSLVDGTIGTRTLQGFTHIASGIIDEDGPQEIWDNIDQEWDGGGDETEKTWDQQTVTQFVRGLLAADPTNSKLFRMDSTETFDGTSFTAFVERTGIAIIGRDRLGQPQLDFTRNKIVKRLWPKISGGTVNIKVGVQDVIDGAVTWSTPVAFNPATDQYVDPDPPPNGRLPAVHISSTGAVAWTLDGYDIELELIGEL